MIHKLLLIIVACLSMLPLWAQDTLLLKEVEVFGIQEEAYAVGTRFETITGEKRLAEGSGSLNNLLNEHTSIYFLQYGGVGQLASINMRGLGPARTSLLWNGMEINSFSLGQQDYNLIPSVVFNQVNIQYGSGSALFGNGALGGSVSLNNDLTSIKKPAFTLRQSAGSFSNYHTTGTAQLVFGKVKSSTKGYYQTSENDFPYVLADSTVRQPNAAYENYGLLQELLWTMDTRNHLTVSGWYNYNFREIQPSRSNPNGQDNLEDENWRTSLTWNYGDDKHKVKTTVGYTDDRNVFNGFSEVRTKRIFLSSQGERALRNNLIVHVGMNWNHLRANATNYADLVIENRNDIFGGVVYSPAERLEVSFTARQPVVNGDFKAFSPSLGTEYRLLYSENLNIDVFGNISRSFRLPTLNDRFWNPGGNENLQPEEGRNFEGGAKSFLQKNGNLLTLETNYFFHLVDQWILWRPGGSGEDENGNAISFWFPENIRKVKSQGFELNLHFERPIIRGILLTFDFSSTYTRSINLTGISDSDRSVGKQLPFTPQWHLTFNNQVSWKGCSLGIIYSFTGQQFVEANNELQPLPSFSLVNVVAAVPFRVAKQEMLGSFRVNNLFDNNYESFENRAMPGINYELTLQLTIQ